MTQQPMIGTIEIGPDSWITRDGVRVRADEAFAASCSGDYERMVAALSLRTHPLDRHHLLQKIVQECYRTRGDYSRRVDLYKYAPLHIAELPALVHSLRRNEAGLTTAITTYGPWARALIEDGRFDDAIQSWQSAHAIGYVTEEELDSHVAKINRKREKALALEKAGR